MFQELAQQGKTIVMVTHDSSLAQRVNRTMLIVDGEIVNEFIARAMPLLTQDQMLEATQKAVPMMFEPGATILREGHLGINFILSPKAAPKSRSSDRAARTSLSCVPGLANISAKWK